MFVIRYTPQTVKVLLMFDGQVRESQQGEFRE